MELAREKLTLTYPCRGATDADLQNWVEGLKDAECNVESKRGSGTAPNSKNVLGDANA